MTRRRQPAEAQQQSRDGARPRARRLRPGVPHRRRRRHRDHLRPPRPAGHQLRRRRRRLGSTRRSPSTAACRRKLVGEALSTTADRRDLRQPPEARAWRRPKPIAEAPQAPRLEGRSRPARGRASSATSRRTRRCRTSSARSCCIGVRQRMLERAQLGRLPLLRAQPRLQEAHDQRHRGDASRTTPATRIAIVCHGGVINAYMRPHHQLAVRHVLPPGARLRQHRRRRRRPPRRPPAERHAPPDDG